MLETRTQKLTDFVTWASRHITGDEKGQAQVFLDRLFQAFGQKGAQEAGGTYEERVRKGPADGGGVSFADYVWKPVVLIEMKKRGADLSRHYRQAFQYWERLVPNRPRYAVLCNFDQFSVYDFDRQLDEPVDTVALAELPARYGPLAFLFPTNERPTFGNDRVAVTRDAADLLARCFNKLSTRGVARPLAQRFILQTLVALFAEDIGLLPKYLLTRLLEDCREPADSYDLLGGLFDAMNRPDGNPGGRYKGVRYFNGGLFSTPARVELYEDEVAQLRTAAAADWAKVSPEIFGTLFQHSLGKEERRAQGAHFTSPLDIMRVVKPTIVDPWTEEIESAKTLKRLSELLERMRRYRVLDPACGSGNFLYIAYRELKRLEARAIERMKEFSSTDADQHMFGFVTAKQFFGLDIDPFAVELAKVTMMIARKLSIEELHIHESDLPLDNLDDNFRRCDALLDVDPDDVNRPTLTADGKGVLTDWPKVDAIIGNPPFVGAKLLKPWRGPEYVNALRQAYPDVPGMADYCVYWIRKANEHLPECTPTDPVAGRAGLVGTQNIRNNQSRVGGLDEVVRTGTLIDAVDNQPWSGEANVHVSIVNWVKTHDPSLVPAPRRLWSVVRPPAGAKPRRVNGTAAKTFELGCREVASISPSLSDETDVSQAAVLSCNAEPQRAFNGQYPRHNGFRLTPDEAGRMIAADPRNREVVHPFLGGTPMLTLGEPDEWVIDFQKMDILTAKSYRLPFARIEGTVLPHVTRLAEAERTKTGKESGQDQGWLATWWQHFRSRPELIQQIGRLSRYMACVEVTKRPIFCFVSSAIRPDKTLEAFTFDDDYSFGILQSGLHTAWFWAKCSNFKSDPRYTPESVFNTFPWPQSPANTQIDAVAAAAREVRRVRADALTKITGGLRAVYRTLELPGKSPLKDAHAALDKAVLDAYGFSPKKDVLQELLSLNQEVARRIAAGEPMTPPGVPRGYVNRARLLTEDRLEANGPP